MKNAFIERILVLALTSLVFVACELQTQEPELPKVNPANTLVINEVFTLPSTNQRTYSWVEFYNPTKDTIRTRGYTLSFTTTGSVVRFAMDSSFYEILQQGDGVYTVPLPEVVVRGGEFLTIVNNEDRMLTYTEWGPGGGAKLAVGELINQFIVVANPDTTRPDTATLYQVQFRFKTTDQLVLKNASGTAIDVVRYGNYAYAGPGSDPYPNNKSIGLVAEYQSIARFNGAYQTGNSSNDFYVTGVQIPLTRPIPHWLSQVYKK
jgi:hypothetical protein